ncbi:23S rRNA methyltransferase attenuation leader peptide [Escherichia coli]|nr:23S rRNA methyltransferase attenuation leader peptide [Escherichia coli]EKB6845712.1 23S rRNA methyltransferase attenuation leader peptide [Escherichia coli]ELZ2389469.1 23S rRNA methyltransferase attenuation leader peptide [Escherichia coli]ELZ2390241.1 23S rRNA methyltransferase attenuation leader peptide [Escherichia coli]
MLVFQMRYQMRYG